MYVYLKYMDVFHSFFSWTQMGRHDICNTGIYEGMDS